MIGQHTTSEQNHKNQDQPDIRIRPTLHNRSIAEESAINNINLRDRMCNSSKIMYDLVAHNVRSK